MAINEELLKRLIDFKEKSGLSQTQIARGVGCAVAAISMFLSKTYGEKGGNYDTLEPKIKAYLDLQDEKSQQEKLEIQFVRTKTARRIAEVMADAHAAGDVTVVWGQAGLGKTQAIKNYCLNNPSSILIEANPTFTALVLLKELMSACKLYSNSGSQNDLYVAVEDRLKDSGRLIVVDEAENLPLRALEVLRRLQDSTHCGLVLVGMPQLMVNLRGNKGQLMQLYSRVNLHLELGNSLPDEDLELIARTNLPNADDDTIKALVKYSDGNTRRMSKLMSGTVRLAAKNQMKLQAGMVKAYSKMIIR